MSDFEGGLPIKTARDNDAAFKLVDGASGATATNKLSIQKTGDAVVPGTNDFGVPVFGKDSTGDYALISLGATGSVVVEAVNLDIRDLLFATDKVDVSGSTAVAVIDGGGSITVDAVDLDIRNLVFATDKVDASGSTGVGVAVTLAQGADGAAAPSQSLQVAGKDGAGNLQTLKTNTAGQLETISVEGTGLEVCVFNTTATVGANSTATYDYVITSGSTFTKMQVLVGARGAAKVEVGTWDGVTFVPKAKYFQQIQNNPDKTFPYFQPVGDGTLAIRLVITNTDGQSSDIYSTLQGLEIS